MPIIKQAWDFVCEPQHSNAIMAIFTAMIFLSGLAYTVFSALQWRATKIAAEAAQNAVNGASDTAIRELRAYIGIRQVGLMGLEDSTPFGVGFAFVNYGKTPASKFNLRGVVDVLPYPLPDDFVLPEPPSRPKQDGVIFPNESNPMVGWVWELETKRLNLKEKLAMLSRETTQEFYAHGFVDYSDVFEIPRHVEFCFALNPASVVRDQTGGIVRDKSGNFKFQWAPVAGHNSFN